MDSYSLCLPGKTLFHLDFWWFPDYCVVSCMVHILVTWTKPCNRMFGDIKRQITEDRYHDLVSTCIVFSQLPCIRVFQNIAPSIFYLDYNNKINYIHFSTSTIVCIKPLLLSFTAFACNQTSDTCQPTCYILRIILLHVCQLLVEHLLDWSFILRKTSTRT